LYCNLKSTPWSDMLQVISLSNSWVCLFCLGPPYTNVNIQRLESVQRCAGRFYLNDFSSYSTVISMLQSLDLPCLKSRRNISKLIIYKTSAFKLKKRSRDFVMLKNYWNKGDIKLQSHNTTLLWCGAIMKLSILLNIGTTPQ